jgi:hypothetical protein
MQSATITQTDKGKQKPRELVAHEEKNSGNKWTHNSIFVKELWKTVGDELSFTIFICELVNSMFYQIKNIKLLELLGRLKTCNSHRHISRATLKKGWR